MKTAAALQGMDTAGMAGLRRWQWLVAMALALLPGMWFWVALPPSSLHFGTLAEEAVQMPAVEPVHPGPQDLAMPLEANSGQFDESVAFMGESSAGQVLVTRQGQIIYRPGGLAMPAARPGPSLTETLDSAQPLSPVGGQLAAAQVKRLVGAQSYQAATYLSVHLGQAWPGIDVQLTAGASHVEKHFHMAPHADARQIQVHVAAARSLRLGEGGELIATTDQGDVIHAPPVAWQDGEGGRIPVPVRYVLNGDDGYGLEVGAYDMARPLVVGPQLQSVDRAAMD